jgi:hypothetical protein
MNYGSLPGHDKSPVQRFQYYSHCIRGKESAVSDRLASPRLRREAFRQSSAHYKLNFKINKNYEPANS